MTEQKQRRKPRKYTDEFKKQLVDLYLGVGKEIRDTVKAIVEMDQLLNGPKDENVTGLMALAEAIRGSVK